MDLFESSDEDEHLRPTRTPKQTPPVSPFPARTSMGNVDEVKDCDDSDIIDHEYRSIQRLTRGSMALTCTELRRETDYGHLASLLTACKQAFEKAEDWKMLARTAVHIATSAWDVLVREGRWPHPALREAFVYAALWAGFADVKVQTDLDEGLRLVDKAIIVAGPSDMLMTLVQLLESRMNIGEGSSVQASIEAVPDDPQAFTSTIVFPVADRDPTHLSPGSFRVQYLLPGQAVYLPGYAFDWPAVRKWSKWGWLSSHHGHRLVPVEIGNHGPGGEGQSRRNWREDTMLLREFVQHYLAKASETNRESIAYLAQHPLLDQIPALRDDVRVPSLITAGEQDEVSINAWLGTAHTETPLHWDSYNNIFVQCVGYKYIRLYSPDQTPLLYVSQGNTSSATTGQDNISEVDVLRPDFSRHPNFASAKYTECVVGPGDALFIPKKTWHFVQSLTPSFSVSFWF